MACYFLPPLLGDFLRFHADGRLEVRDRELLEVHRRARAELRSPLTADKDADDPIPEDDQAGAGILSSLEAAGREAKGVMERHPYVKDAAEGALALGGLVATGGLAAPEEAAKIAAEERGTAAAEAGNGAAVPRGKAPPLTTHT